MTHSECAPLGLFTWIGMLVAKPALRKATLCFAVALRARGRDRQIGTLPFYRFPYQRGDFAVC